MKHHHLLATSAIAVLAAAGGAQAQDAVYVNIAPGDLAPALTAYSRATGLQVVANGDLVRNKRTSGVVGSVTPRQGLDRLLSGTGLAATMRGQAALIVRAGGERSPTVTGASETAFIGSGEADPEARLEEVIVTGSRIVRRDYTAESPTVTLDQAVLQAGGPASLETALNQLPQFAATSGSTSISSASAGRANANLRGLGVARTLVLMDGRRMQPSDPLGAVDLNTIAPALIKTVEVITGGASAVYGSDAIAGVANFRLRDDFQGFEFDTQYMETGRSDGEAFDASILMGGNFADGRGNAVLSMSYFERQEVLRRNRPFFKDGGVTAVIPSGLVAAVATNLPSQAAMNALMATYGIAPGVRNSSTFGTNPDGSLFTLTAPIANFKWPKDGPYIISSGQIGISYGEHSPLQQPMDRQNVFGRMTYELTDSIRAYAQFSYTHYTADQNAIGRNQAITRDVYVPITNPFLPTDLKTLMASRPNPNAPILFYFNTGRFAPARAEQTFDVYQGVVGLTGRIDAIDGTWDVYGSYGRTNRLSLAGGHVDRAAFLSLVEAADGGVSICEGGLKPMEIAPPSAQCLNYLLRTVRETEEFEQAVLEGSVQGRLFALPAGDARFALGFSSRSNDYAFQPDEQRIRGTLLASSLSSPTEGSVTMNEVFGEAVLPLLSGLPMIEALDLSVAYRYSDYDTIGAVSTYKVAADWDVVPALKVRGGYQRAIRAPSLGELFRPAEEGGTVVGRTAAGRGDPCDVTGVYRTGANAAQVRVLCIATGVPETLVDTLRFVGTSVQSVMAGNPDLEAEVADTYTAGIVWRPRFEAEWLSGLSVSVDYYDITLKKAIGMVTGEVIAQRCFNGQGDSNPTYDPNNYYCTLMARGPSGGFSLFQTPLLNMGGYETSGVDVQFDWRMPVSLGRIDGTVGVNTLVSWMGRYAIQTLEGAPFVDYAGTIGNAQISSEAISHPEWKAFTTLSWRSGATDVAILWRWIDAMDNSSNVGATTATAAGVTDRHYFDVTVRRRINDRLEGRFGVVNLADTQPPEWTGESATDPAAYDVLGRRFYLGLNLSF